MGRLNLVICDIDEAYTESIVNFLMTNHSQRFQVSSFTKKNLLEGFLNQNSKKIDVLLICPEFYGDDLSKNNITSIVLLASGNMVENIPDVGVIKKYQHGDKLVGDLINIISDKSEVISLNSVGTKKTKVVAVYSPIGGVGKTTISMCLSKQCAKVGLQVFYLNIEALQSTSFFFNCKGEQNISSILFYIKEKSKNLQLKIEGSRHIDSDTNVHYFCPPDSMFDIQEVESDEIKKLVSELKDMAQYDIVFVDMSSELNNRNLALLEVCDEIILAFPQDAVSGVKAELFEKELEIIRDRKKIDVSDKITIVLNKYSSHMALEIDTISICDKSIEYYIPMTPGLVSIKGNIDYTDIFSDFCDSIQELVDKYM